MSEAITFFRRRESDSGETYRIEIGPSRMYVHSRKRLDTKLLQQAAGRNEIDRAEGELRQAISNNGNAGVIAIASDDGSGRELRVKWCGAKSSQSPDEFLVVTPGRAPYFLERNERVPPGTHVIVPVDQDAARHLHDFVDHLAALPPDLESLVLTAIRRPSLDTRLSKVETKVFGDTATETPGGGWFARTIGAVPAVAYRVAAMVVLAVLLGANAWFLREVSGKLGKTEEGVKNDEQKAGMKAAQASVVAVKTQEAAKTVDLLGEARPLIEALRAKSDAPLLKELYASHFAALERQPFKESDIPALFDSKPFLWGLIKLQALELVPSPPDRTFLKKVDAWSPTKKVFSDYGVQRIQGEDLDLLAAAACRMKYASPKVPGLPAGDDPPLEFVPNRKCTDYTDQHLAAGLESLTEFVEKQK